jgi:hypothetical protein
MVAAPMNDREAIQGLERLQEVAAAAYDDPVAWRAMHLRRFLSETLLFVDERMQRP